MLAHVSTDTEIKDEWLVTFDVHHIYINAETAKSDIANH